MKPIFLSVIISAYNEQDNFARGTLGSIKSYLSSQKYSWEFIVVNDGSTDNTLSQLRSFAGNDSRVKIMDIPHQGKAGGIIAGATAAKGEIVLFADMDQATPISEIEKFLPKFAAGYDIVIGSRANRQGAPFYRQVLAYGMVVFRTLLLNLPYRDTQCGFKAFSQKAASVLFAKMKKIHPAKVIVGPAVNPGFDVELLYLGRKLGFKIAQVPVDWHHQKSVRVRFLRDAVSGISELLLVRFRSFTKIYNT